MEFLLVNGSAPAREIEQSIPDPPTNAAVRALLRVMLEKRLIEREYDGPKYVYRPVMDSSKAKHSLLKGMVNRLFGGSRTELFANLIDSEEENISDAELEELEQLIAKVRKRKKGPEKKS